MPSSTVPVLLTPSETLASTTLSGPPPVIEGEDGRGYAELLARVADNLQPADILEEMWVRDIVQIAWDAFGLRRNKAHCMTQAAARQVRELIAPYAVGDPGEIARKWELGDEAAAQRVEAALAAAGLSIRSLVTRKLELWVIDLDFIERIDRMLAGMEKRRNAALTAMERYHANFAERLRRVVEDAEENDLKVRSLPLVAAPAQA